MKPFYSSVGKEKVSIDSDCSLYLTIGFFPPAFRENESYNKLFNKKYAAFKNSAIKTMDGAELNYFIFSASQLGWVNCDFFWQLPNEKMDYVVKVAPGTTPNMKLVFSNPKVIVDGVLSNHYCIFTNVPKESDVKIVSISFKDSQPFNGSKRDKNQ